MTLKRSIPTLALVALLFALLAFAPGSVTPPASVAFAQSQDAAPHCVPVGGMLMTNFAVINEVTTLGTVTGDLRGAVSATILSVSLGANGTTVFTVQHHFVTEAGDIVTAAPANATVASVGPGLLAVVSFPVQITGGTGKFARATGMINFIGEANVPNLPDLAGGRLVLRYSGQVCFGAPSRP